MEWTVKEVTDFFFYIEKKYDLFHQKYAGIYIWKLLRMPLYREISEKIGLYGNSHPDLIENSSIYYKIKQLWLREKMRMRDNQRIGKKKGIMVVRSGRNVELSGERVDLYTFHFEKMLKDQEKEILIVSKEYKNHQSDTVCFYESFIGRLFAKVIFSFFYMKKKSLLNKVEIEIEKKFLIKIKVGRIACMLSADFLSKKHYFYKKLKIISPEKLYFVCSYGSEAMIEAARINGIETIEIQHGLVSKYNLGYHFPDLQTVPYFPDKFLFFGQFWTENAKLPLEKNRQIIYGYPYLSYELKQYEKVEPQNKTVIFITQGTITSPLARIAADFAKRCEDYYIIFKLHPSEYKSWRRNYPILEEASKKKQFTVIDNNKSSLYQYLSKAKIQVGVNSTAVFEGLALGLITFIIDLPGSEFLESLVENGAAKMVKTAEELAVAIQNFKPATYDKEYYFKKVVS